MINTRVDSVPKARVPAPMGPRITVALNVGCIGNRSNNDPPFANPPPILPNMMINKKCNLANDSMSPSTFRNIPYSFFPF